MSPIDIIQEMLRLLMAEYPHQPFFDGLYQQYINIGGLSKKQLEGLRAKAAKSGLFTDSKLATLDAIIKKKPTRYRSDKISKAPEFKPDLTDSKMLLNLLLEKYPHHKMAQYLMNKINSNQILTEFEIKEVKRLAGLLLKK